MKEMRFWKKIIIVILAIVVIVCVGIPLSNVVYDNYLKTDEVTLLENYEAKKEKCELLRIIPNDFVEEGKGINLQEIPDNIRYEIKNKKDGNLEFYYYIEQEISSNSNSYNARIILSKDYKIIEEIYGIELEDFETFKHHQLIGDRMLSVLCVMTFIFLAYIIIEITNIFIKSFKNKKSRS